MFCKYSAAMSGSNMEEMKIKRLKKLHRWLPTVVTMVGDEISMD